MENAPFDIRPYTASSAAVWNGAAKAARQSSFLFQRGYMDYHADRFRDASLLIYNAKGKLRGLFPANRSNTVEGRIESHGGLTYGGLLTTADCGTAECMRMLDAVARHYKDMGFHSLLYKTVPHIYHTLPAEEDLYWLFRRNARLFARNVSAAADLSLPPRYSVLRKRKIHAAQKASPALRMVTGVEWLPAYWAVLESVLRVRHSAAPVHTYEEMRRLMALFPEEITLYAAVRPAEACGCAGTETRNTADGTTAAEAPAPRPESSRLLAGCVVYHTGRVAHLQYIAASDEGCERHAFDWLADKVAEAERKRPRPARYLDFGTSNERNGRLLNEGLIFQKEGFGARAVCYDQYLLEW